MGEQTDVEKLQIRISELEQIVGEFEQIERIDSIVKKYAGTQIKKDPRKTLALGLSNIAAEMDSGCEPGEERVIFVNYLDPRTFDGKERTHTTIVSSNAHDDARNILEKRLHDYMTQYMIDRGSEFFKTEELIEDHHILTVPMFDETSGAYVGMAG